MYGAGLQQVEAGVSGDFGFAASNQEQNQRFGLTKDGRLTGTKVLLLTLNKGPP